KNKKLQIVSLFPDTVHKSKDYGGFFIFKSPFDTITTKMFGNTYNREVVLQLKPNKKYSVDRDFYVDSLSIYRFVAYDNRKIPYYGFTFNVLGTFYLKGKIKDSYLVNNKVC